MNLLIGVTGSVGAIKLPELVKSIKALLPHVNIKIVATENSFHFVNKEDVPVEVFTDQDEWKQWKHRGDPVLHIEFRKWADVFLIAPMDANTLAKMANGLCDNILTSVLRCWNFEKRLVLCPAMNTMMWEHPVTAQHIEMIRSFDPYIIIVPPIKKTLICGDVGLGAMEELDEIIQVITPLLSSN